MTPATPPGWFGKIPNLGDFVTRRLPDTFVRPWDDWLQHGLALMRTRLFEDELEQCAGCRFWIGPGVLGEPSWMGILTPSVDRVGRRFPLTLAAPIDSGVEPTQSLAGALAAQEWFAALDRIVEQTRDEQFTADAVESALAALQQESQDDVVDESLVDALLHRRCARAENVGALTDVESDAMLIGSALISIWWHVGAHQVNDFMHFDELPPPHALAKLLEARGGAEF